MHYCPVLTGIIHTEWKYTVSKLLYSNTAIVTDISYSLEFIVSANTAKTAADQHEDKLIKTRSDYIGGICIDSNEACV